MSHIVDWSDLGVFPLQDHDPKTLPEIRQQLVGARISNIGIPGQGAGFIEVGTERGKGTFGDIHPWVFWQTSDRASRGMGSWAQSFASVVTDDGGDGRYRPKLLPILNQDYETDTRYVDKSFGWPDCLGSLPRGTLVMHVGGTEEYGEMPLAMHTDPRLVAPSVGGPASCGTQVVDLQPIGELCTGGAEGGTQQGRSAYLQSMARVVATKTGGNMLAWNLGIAPQGELFGYGASWGITDSSSPQLPPPTTPGSGRGPTTPGSGTWTRQNEWWKQYRDRYNQQGGAENGPQSTGLPLESGKEPCDFGMFQPTPVGGHGTALMAQDHASGPLCIGHAEDKHQIGVDADGNPINAGHISTAGYFYGDQMRDGPLYFEQQFYPEVRNFRLRSPVHLVWDDDLTHNFVGGARRGMWRWYAEVPYVSPPTTPPPPIDPPGGPGDPTTPGTPRTPGNPGTPGSPGVPGTPRTPGIPPDIDPPRLPDPVPDKTIRMRPGVNIGVQDPMLPPGDDLIGDPYYAPQGGNEAGGSLLVGSQIDSARSLYSILHPSHESFGAIGFRPQLWARGVEAFEHNPAYSEHIYDEEYSRPQVLSLRPWAAQTDSPGWDYTERPNVSRARGGTANGGILFAPPEFEMEDYFGLGNRDTSSPATTGYITAAPGAEFALGEPVSDGGLTAASVVLNRNTASADAPFRIQQLNSSRALTTLLQAFVSQSGGTVEVNTPGDLSADGNVTAGGYKTAGGETGITQVVSFLADGTNYELTFTEGLLTGYSAT